MPTRPASADPAFDDVFAPLAGAQSMLALAWCVGGAGIYGSPFGILKGPAALQVLAFLLLGPLSAGPAAFLRPFRPKLAARWLVLGGVLSTLIALTWIHTDAGLVPLLVSVPMVAMGRRAWRTPDRADVPDGVGPAALVGHLVLAVGSWLGLFAAGGALTGLAGTWLGGGVAHSGVFRTVYRNHGLVLAFPLAMAGLVTLPTLVDEWPGPLPMGLRIGLWAGLMHLVAVRIH